MKQPVVLFASLCFLASEAMQLKTLRILRKRMSYQTHTWIHNGTGISRQPFKSMYGIR